MEIIRPFPPATCLMGNLLPAIVVVLMRTYLVKLAVEGHVGCDIQMEIIGAIICSLLRLVKERFQNRLIQDTLQARPSWLFLHELEINDVLCPEKQGLFEPEIFLEFSGLGVVTLDPRVNDHSTARIGTQPNAALRMVMCGYAPLWKRHATQPLAPVPTSVGEAHPFLTCLPAAMFSRPPTPLLCLALISISGRCTSLPHPVSRLLCGLNMVVVLAC